MNYKPVVRKNSKNPLKLVKNPQNLCRIGTFFHNPYINPSTALRENRIHCMDIERTAIMTDAHGNRLVLKENQTCMNTPDNNHHIVFNDRRKRRWNKKR